MEIQRFYDEDLAQASYIVSSDARAVIIDPARKIQPYLDYLETINAQLIGILMTHPHADFVSGHWELNEVTRAPIMISHRAQPSYEHVALKGHDVIPLNGAQFLVIETPGHSPDSLTFLLNYNGNDVAIFPGDTLLIGGVGRPDLREDAGAETADRKEQARELFHTLRDKIMGLEPGATVYPTHGPGSLCSSHAPDDKEKRDSPLSDLLKNNPALREDLKEKDFVDWLLKDLPYIPKYYNYNVAINRAGAPPLAETLAAIPRLPQGTIYMTDNARVIDTRGVEDFRQSHLPKAINLQNGRDFTQWLGSIIGPKEPFYLLTGSEDEFESILERTAKIGYERQVLGIGRYEPAPGVLSSPELDVEALKNTPRDFTIVDVRQPDEANSNTLFNGALNFPLYELRERAGTIPRDRPIVVHCSSGYRSAAGASILQGLLGDYTTVYDLGDKVEGFK